MRNLLLVVVGAGVLLPASAWATCMTSCKATLMLANCTEPTPADEWPLSQPLGFTAECETCCAAPGGPANCNPDKLDPKLVKILAGAIQVPGEVTPTGKLCGDEPRFVFSGKLQAGDHSVVHASMILVTFKVTGKAGCTTDADCAGCTSCEAGQCVALTCKATCKTDADCAPTDQCVQTEPGCCSECQKKPAADAGSTDVAATDGGATDGATTDTADAQTGDPGAVGADAPSTADGAQVADNTAAGDVADAGGVGATDAGKATAAATPAPKSDGCAAGSTGSPAGALAALLIAAGWAVQTRRRLRRDLWTDTDRS